MKKLRLLLFSLCALAVTSVSAAVGNQFSVTYESGVLVYTVLTENADDAIGTVSVARASNITGEIIIPQTVERDGISYTVTSVSNNGFSGASGITKITLPETCVNIPSGAFQGCTSLLSINLPEGITIINAGTFYNCSSLENIVLPQSLTNINVAAFGGCTGLKSITLNSSPTIGTNCFYNVGSSNSPCELIIPNGFAFDDNTTPSNEAFAFAGGYFFIADFEEGERPTSFTLGDYFYEILSENSDSKTGTVIISLAENANPSRISIPSSVTYKNYVYNVTKIAEYAFQGSACTRVDVGNNITEISEGAFKDCTGITNIYIPNSVTQIANSAFENCSSLQTISLIGIEHIGNKAFSNCSGLTSVTLTNNSTSPDQDFASFGNDVFSNVGSAESPCKLIADFSSYDIGVRPSNDAFAWQGGMFYMENYTKPRYFSRVINKYEDGMFDGFSYEILTEDDASNTGTVAIGAINNGYNVRQLTGDITIPSTVDHLGYTYTVSEIRPSGFRYTKVERVFGGEEIVKIGSEAFGYDKKNMSDTLLVYFNFGPKLKEIGTSAFAYSKIKKAILPEGFTTFGSKSFYGCTELTDVYIPSTTTMKLPTIWYTYCFSGCTSLANVTFGENSSMEYLPTCFFQNCKSLIQVNLPAGIQELQTGCFDGCSNLRVLKLPNSLKTFELFSHFANTAITHLTFPSHIENTYGKLQTPDVPPIATEVTVTPELNSVLIGPNSNLEAIYIIGDTIPHISSFYYTGPIYVKPSVYREKYSDGQGQFMGNPDITNTVSYKIPITMKNAAGNGIRYKSLCRDFDVDLTHTNDNLPEGIEPLRAYLVDDVDGELRMVFMNEIKYIPSRLKANVTDENGNLYQGVDEYVGVVLRGTPGYTYYCEMGEHDYTQGVEGQWLMDDAMAYSGSSDTNNLMSGTANDDEYVFMTSGEDEEIVNYGLNDNRFKIYRKDGWLTYNKAYLRLPKSTSDAIERKGSANSKLTFIFDNSDGTTDRIANVDLSQESDSSILYSPSGQRISGAYNGIAISKGKKKVVHN